MASFMAIMAQFMSILGHFLGLYHIQNDPTARNKEIKHVPESWSKVMYCTQHGWWKKLTKTIFYGHYGTKNGRFWLFLAQNTLESL